MDNRLLTTLCLVLFIVGSLVGYTLAPDPTVKVVETEVVVPGPVEVKEIEVVREVSDTEELESLRVENQELLESYESLVDRYEELRDERFDPDEFDLEQEYIERAKELLEGEYKYLFLDGDYTLSEIRVGKYTDEDARIRTVTRYVDGKRVDYDLPKVELSLKVVYDDGEERSTKYYGAIVEWDLDRDGDEEETVLVTEE